jgi:hypothetical protein
MYNLSNFKEIPNEKIILPKNVGKIVNMKWMQNG